MLSRSWVRYVTVGLIATCITAAFAHDNSRIRVNNEILECRPPHGCFLVETYVVRNDLYEKPRCVIDHCGSACGYHCPSSVEKNDNANGRNPTEYQQQQSTDKIEASPIITVSQVQKPKPDDGEEGTTENLEVQKGIRYWTRWAAIIGTMGLLLVVATVVQTSRAANFAKQTLDTTREIGSDQTRAHVGVTAVIQNIQIEQKIKSLISIENFGNSPAQLEYSFKTSINSGSWSQHNSSREVMIAPREILNFSQVVHATMLNPPENGVFVDCTLNFKDIYGRKTKRIYRYALSEKEIPNEQQLIHAHNIPGHAETKAQVTATTVFGESVKAPNPDFRLSVPMSLVSLEEEITEPENQEQNQSWFSRFFGNA